MEINNIPLIAITGGPCGGKTTGLNYIREKLADYGFLTLVVPEAATLTIMAGINPGNLSKEEFYFFDKQTFFTPTSTP